MIEYKDIYFEWELGEDTHRLGPINFKSKKGEILGLFGESGSGKSTLLRLALNELVPDRGKIFLSEHLKNVVYHDQYQKLLPWLSGEQNVLINFSGKMSRITPILSLCGLDNFGRKKPAQLSGGQRARIALARTLVNDADLKLYDEPFSGIDVVNQHKIIEHLKENHNNFCSILTTHDPAILIQLCEKVVCLKQKNGSTTSENFNIAEELHLLSPKQRRKHILFVGEVKRLLGMLYE